MTVRKKDEFLTVAESILSSGGLISFRAKGFSMQPAVIDGDVLEARAFSFGNLKRGDIILYEDEEGKPVVHRLIVSPKVGGMVMTKGDSMAAADRPVSAERVLGKIVSIKRNGRRINLGSFRFRLINAVRFHPLFRKLCGFKKLQTVS